ncbi:MAG: tryptophan-rich sensory protein [Candidatus Doudnabacteria bacterium]|nr:tryptophan-rich sensory protein [Candidatus Doudnabacteria bacterium]
MSNILKLFASVIVSQAAGLIGAVFTRNSVTTWYANLNKPSFAPPNWLFGPVWTLLYLLMGIAVFLVWKQGLKTPYVKVALVVFVFQLVLNTLWSIIFFNLRSPGVAFIEIIALWLSIAVNIYLFAKVSETAAWLLVPYILWVSFAGLLNYYIYALN